MMKRAGHVNDDRLLECYYAERGGEPVDPRVVDHLTDCTACSERYADVVRVLDEVRTTGIAEADAIFTTDHLRAQRQHIAARLEHVGRSARVISFPRHTDGGVMTLTTRRIPPRWIGAAAAAGLFIGVALGASYQWESRARDTDPFGRASARLAPVATRGSGAADVAADDAFLSELDAALDRPRTRELLAYDALTPHVREIRDQR
jgi:hypothetical protein